MKKITVVARDKGGSVGLQPIADHWKKMGGQANIFLGHGAEIPTIDLLDNAVRSSDVVLCGMSSSPELSDPEMRAMVIAMEQDIPFGMFADVFNSHLRTWLQEFFPKAAFFIVLNELEAEKAKDQFPGLNAVGLGNPAWEEAATVRIDPRKIRSTIGVSKEDFIVLAVGTKELAVNFLLWTTVIEGAANLNRVKIIGSIHPGDRNDPKLYSALETLSNGQFELVESSILSGADILPESNLIIDSMSTMSVQAGLLRKPIATLMSNMMLNRLEKINGNRIWEPVKMGITIPVYNCLDISGWITTIKSIRTNPVLARQRIVFPKPPEPGATVKKIREFIEAL